MRLLLLALVAVVARAQSIAIQTQVESGDWVSCSLRAPGTNPEIIFAPQPFSRIPYLDEYRVCVVAPQDRDLQIEGMRVIVEGLHRNLRIYTYNPLNAYVQDLNKRSGWRYALLICEVAGHASTVVVSGDLAKIKELLPKVAIPAGAATCTMLRYVTDRQYEPVVIPPDGMQPLIAVPAGRAVDFAVWAAPKEK